MGSERSDGGSSTAMEGIMANRGPKNAALSSEALALAVTKGHDQLTLQSPNEQSWQLYRPIIRQLYVEENKTLNEVMEIMLTSYCWKATTRQWKSKLSQWGFNKNIKSSQLSYMIRIQQARSECGKKTQFWLRGQVVDPLKIERWAMKHSGSAESAANLKDVMDLDDPDINFNTPPASDSESIIISDGKLPPEEQVSHSSERLQSKSGTHGGPSETRGHSYGERKGKRAWLNYERRKEVAVTRSVGACERCRKRKVRCTHALEEAKARQGSEPVNQPTAAPKDSQVLDMFENQRVDHNASNDCFLMTRAASPTPRRFFGTESESSLQRGWGEELSHSQSVLPRSSSIMALLICWEDEEDMGPISELASVLEYDLNVCCRIFKIPFAKCNTKLQSAVLEFCSRSSPNGLKIVYYAGLGENLKDNQFTWSSRTNPSLKTSWTSCQLLLEEGDSDVLLLFDCPVVLDSGISSIAIECLAASTSTPSSLPGREFTRLLSAELKTLGRAGQPFDTKILYVRLLRRLLTNGSQTITPVHVTLSSPNNPEKRIQQQQQQQSIPIISIRNQSTTTWGQSTNATSLLEGKSETRCLQ